MLGKRQRLSESPLIRAWPAHVVSPIWPRIQLGIRRIATWLLTLYRAVSATSTPRHVSSAGRLKPGLYFGAPRSSISASCDAQIEIANLFVNTLTPVRGGCRLVYANLRVLFTVISPFPVAACKIMILSSNRVILNIIPIDLITHPWFLRQMHISFGI